MYEVTVKVTDSKSNSDEQDVTVKVTNVEEPGTIELSTLQPRVGFSVTATLDDPDNVTADSVSWRWYRGATLVTTNLPEECAETTSNNCAIKDAASDAYTPVTDDIGDTLNAVATYTDGSPNEGDAKDVVAMAAAQLVLVDTRNKAPVFPDQDTEMEGRQTAQERSVDENTASAQNIGAPVTATDEDTALTYSLGGPGAASFAILRNSGQLQTKAELDKETKDTYTVTVTAADSLNERFNHYGDHQGHQRGRDAGLGRRRAGGLRRERHGRGDHLYGCGSGGRVDHLVSGRRGDMEDFSMENGVLRFKSSPDFEDPADTGSNNTYVVTVQASDGGQDTTATEEVTIKVTNVEEPRNGDAVHVAAPGG